MDAKTNDSGASLSDIANSRNDQEASRVYRRFAVMRSASLLEVVIYFIITFGFAYRQVLISDYGPPRSYLIAVTSPDVLLSLGMIFVSYFSLILNGKTLVVGLLTRMGGIGDLGYMQPLALEERVIGQRTDAATSKTAPDLSPSLRNHEITPVASDVVESNFGSYIVRSQDAARVAQRRPNALLFVGTTIAAAGLIFFVLTLPGSRYGFLDVTPGSTTDLKADFWSSAIQLLPRLLMLIFIQVLAGFFLKQYRSSMEDFRYYESVLRHREAQYLSYTLRKQMNDKKALLHFADDLLKDREFGQLSHGQTTATIEAQKAEANEFSSLYERLAAVLSRAEAKERKPLRDGAKDKSKVTPS